MSNSLDPDQAQHFVRSDLGPNCLQSSSADHISKQVKSCHGSTSNIDPENN